MPTIEQYTKYLSECQKAFNLTEISRIIGMDASNLFKAINGKPDSKGRIMKIPRRCLPILDNLFNYLNIKIPGD